MRRKTLRWAALALALAGLTCRDNHPIGPGAAGRAVFDVRAFALLAPGDPPVPVESLEVVFRRTDESIAFADTVDLAAVAQGDSFVVSLDVPLDETPQDFVLTLRAFGGGTDWYAAGGPVTLVQGANDPVAPVVTYVGPGANAASVLLVIPTTRMVGGVATPLSAIVHDSSGTPLSGVPVGFRVANAAVASVSGALLNSATLTAAQPIRDSTWVYAETPTHHLDSVRVHVVPPPTTLDSVSGGGQAGPPGVPLAVPFVVRVRDGLGDPFAGATVTWAVTGGTGTLSATTTVTDASGLASVTLTPLSLGVITVQATAPGLAGSPRTFTATGGSGPAASLAKISGDNQTGAGGAALGQPLVVEVRDAFSNPVANATVNWATTSGGSFAPASGLTGANGQAQTTWTLGPSAPSQVATATVGALAPVTFSATAIVGTPAISLSFEGIPGVGVGLSTKVYVDLNQPASAGGIAISLASDNTSIFTVAPPNLTIPQGKTRDSATVSGVSPGQGTLTATGAGYASGTLSVVVQNRNIAVPQTLNVPYGQTASLPIQLPAPAPAGGVTFSVASSDPARVGVSTPSVTITGGSQAANATLTGVLPGPATITVSNPAYIDGVTAATTTASLNIVQGSASLNASFGTSIDLNFESNGTPAAAPAPGISVALTSSDLSCLAATSPVTIATGLVSTTATLTYGGSAPLPCTTKLLAQATNLLADSINVTVTPVPGISVGTLTVGSGLQDNTNFTLGAPNHGDITVTLTSSNAAVLLSPNATTAGQSQITLPVADGVQTVGFYVQALEGRTTDTIQATVTVSAPGFSDGTATMTAQQAALDLQGLPGTTTTLSPSNFVYARVGTAGAGNGSLNQVQNVRAGAPGPLTVTFTTPANGIGELLKAGTAAGVTQTATIPIGVYYTPFDTTTGGVAFHPLSGLGTTTVSVAIPGLIATTQATRSITNSTPNISVGSLIVGSGLQDNTNFTLGASNHGSITVTLTSSNAAVLLSPNATTAGQSQITLPVANGVQTVGFYVQGLEGLASAVSGTVTVSAPGFNDGIATETIVQAALDLQGVPATMAVGAPDANIYVRVGTAAAGNGSLNQVQAVRAGLPAGSLSVSLTSSDLSAATLVNSAGGTGSPQAVLILPGQSNSPTTVSAGGAAVRRLAAGSSSISAASNGLTTTGQGTRSVTVQ